MILCVFAFLLLVAPLLASRESISPTPLDNTHPAFLVPMTAAPLSSCFTEGSSWSSDEVVEIHNDVNDHYSCQELCIQSGICTQFTWYDEHAFPLNFLCLLFNHPKTEHSCSNCISGPQSCTCSGPFSCQYTEDNFVGELPDVQQEVLCQDQCFVTENCAFYSWFDGDFHPFPNLCLMFSSCEEKDFICLGCHSGPPDCSNVEIITTASSTTTTTLPTSTTTEFTCDIPPPQKHGDWFCPPSIDHSTCHLECHPGYVSTNATVITCHHGEWTETPTCVMAVAIITAGETPSHHTVEVYGEGLHKKLPNLPYIRQYHSLELVNSILFLCGGISTRTSCLSFTESHQWTTHSTTTFARDRHSSVSIMAQLHLLGGVDSKSTTEHLTPSSQDWTSGWDLLEDTYYACAAKIEPEVFLMTGGYYNPSSVVAYNVTSGAAARLQDLITPRFYHGCALVMDSWTNMRSVLVAGGSNYDSGYLSESEIYDVNTGEWSTTGKLKINRKGVKLVVLGNKILALGGFYGSSCTSTVDSFNLTTRTWESTEEMLEKRSHLAATGVPSTMVEILTN